MSPCFDCHIAWSCGDYYKDQAVCLHMQILCCGEIMTKRRKRNAQGHQLHFVCTECDKRVTKNLNKRKELEDEEDLYRQLCLFV